MATALSDFLTGQPRATGVGAAALGARLPRPRARRTYERALGLPSDACALADPVRRPPRLRPFRRPAALVLRYADDPRWLHDLAGIQQHAPMVLAQAQAMLTWRMLRRGAAPAPAAC